MAAHRRGVGKYGGTDGASPGRAFPNRASLLSTPPRRRAARAAQPASGHPSPLHRLFSMASHESISHTRRRPLSTPRGAARRLRAVSAPRRNSVRRALPPIRLACVGVLRDTARRSNQAAVRVEATRGRGPCFSSPDWHRRARHISRACRTHRAVPVGGPGGRAGARQGANGLASGTSSRTTQS